MPNPYYNPDEDADLLGSSRPRLDHATAIQQVVQHMAGGNDPPSAEAKLIADVMGLLGHDSMAHQVPIILAALVDKSDATPEQPVDLDVRWTYRTAEMHLQYCWVDLNAIDAAIEDTEKEAEDADVSTQFVVELLKDYLSRRLSIAVAKYRQTCERLSIPTDEHFIAHGFRAENSTSTLHAKMLNSLGTQGSLDLLKKKRNKPDKA